MIISLVEKQEARKLATILIILKYNYVIMDTLLYLVPFRITFKKMK